MPEDPLINVYFPSLFLKGRTIKVSEAVTATFEERMASVGLDQNWVFYFPVYGELCVQGGHF